MVSEERLFESYERPLLEMLKAEYPHRHIVLKTTCFCCGFVPSRLQGRKLYVESVSGFEWRRKFPSRHVVARPL